MYGYFHYRHTGKKQLQIKNDYKDHVVIKLVNLRRISHIPPAPALAADGHTGALLLQQADVGAPLSVRPVSLGPL